jgi:Leucine-rich repeat (LRR) protein
LKVLVLQDNNISFIPKSIESLSQLERINLNSNSIDSIACDFSKFKFLKKLDLSSNRIKSIIVQNPLSMMETLRLQRNQLSEVNNNFFVSSLLLEFNCANNRIETLPETIGKNINLQKLNLKKNQLKKVPQTISECKELKYFNLSDNQLKEINFLIDFSKLETLKISGNQLVTFPEISKPGSIKFYDISDNQIFVIPNDIIEYTSLQELDVSFNSIKNIDNIQYLCHLEKFFAIKNKIEKIEFNNPCLNSLRILGLNENEITDISIDFLKLEKLEIIELRGNNLSEFRINKNLNSIRKIDIGENNILHFPEDLLILTGLKKIDLTYNSIDHIPESLFYLDSLIQFECQSCDLTEFPDIKSSSSIVNLFLGNNKLTAIDLTFFNNLIELELSSNPLEIFRISNEHKLVYLDVDNTKLNEEQLDLLRSEIENVIFSDAD